MVESIRKPRNIVFAFVVILTVVAIKLAWPTPVRAATVNPNANLVSTLLRTGLDPASLAAAGVGSSPGSSVVAGVKAYIVAHPTSISSVDSSFESARVNYDKLARLVQSGLGSDVDVVACQQAEANLASATSARKAALDAAYAAGIANLTEPQKSALGTIQANRSWGFPIQYLAKNRAEADCVALRDALAVKRISEKSGESIPESVTQLLQAENGDLAVSTAKTNSDTYLASVTTSWNQAVQD